MGGILADTGGEHNGVHAVQSRRIGADMLGHTIAEGFHGDGCLLIALFHGLGKIAEVTGDTGQAQHAGLLVQHLKDFFQRQMLLFGDVLDDARIQITAAGAHDKTLQRCQPHGGIHRFAVFYGGDAGAITQMAHDDPGIVRIQLRKMMDPLGNVIVGGAVEAIAPYLMLLIVLMGNTVEIRLGRHSLVKGGVKHAHHRHIRHDLPAGTHADKVGGIVKRCQIVAGLYFGDDLIVNDHRSGKFFTAVYQPVPHRTDLAERTDHAVRLVCQGRKHGLNSRTVIRQWIVFHHSIAARRRVCHAAVNTDAFTQAGGQHFF